MGRRQAQPRSIRIEIPHLQSSVLLEKQNQTWGSEADRQPEMLSWSRLPRKHRMLLAVLAVLLVLLPGGAMFLAWCSARDAYSATDVSVYRVSSQAVTETVGGSGVLYPNHEVVVQYPETAQVLAVNVKTGQTVRAGQALLKLNPGQFSALVQKAQARLATAQAYLQAVTQKGTAPQVAAAQRRVALAQSADEQILQQQNSLLGGNITSSISGVVTQVNVNPGDIVSANTPLLTVMDESTLVVHTLIPLTSVNQVQVNEKASVTVWAASAMTVTGTVVAIVPAADTQTATCEVWVAVPNTTGSLLAGMSAFVMMQSRKTLLVVPRLAVIDRDRDPQVFVIGADGRAHLRSVQICARSADLMMIDRGLTNGQQVVVGGLDSLLDNQMVHVISVDK